MASENNNVSIGADRSDITIAKPRRVLHFSDGTMEEFDDEEEIQPTQAQSLNCEPAVDPKTLAWGPWISHYAWSSGTMMLNAVDYAGEGLATFFGITTPKYQIEINEYERMLEEKRKIDDEAAGWVPKNEGGAIPLVMVEPTRENITNSPV